MYSREEKLKAVELFIKYDKNPASVIRELGYPCRAAGLASASRRTISRRHGPSPEHTSASCRNCPHPPIYRPLSETQPIMESNIYSLSMRPHLGHKRF